MLTSVKVIFSSLLQSSAVAFFFLVSKIHRMARRLKLRGRGNVEANDVIDPFQSGPTSRFFSATEAIMVDFQEAQILFVLTMQIATLISFSQAQLIQDSSTYAEAGAAVGPAREQPNYMEHSSFAAGTDYVAAIWKTLVVHHCALKCHVSIRLVGPLAAP